ncbi:hypothetical protein ACF0OJ_005108 [Escherichia coli]
MAARFFLENGEQKHAKDFEAAKEQCRIDNHGQNHGSLAAANRGVAEYELSE